MSQQPPQQFGSVPRWDDEDPLIAKYIEAHPGKPDASNARLKDYGYSVWSLVYNLQGTNSNVARVASDYQIPEEAVLAALAFYRHHPAAIDLKILEHDVYFGVRA